MDVASDQTAFISLVSATFILSVVSIILFYRHKHSYWSKKNIPGPKPFPVFGHFLQLLLSKAKVDIDWAKEYGKIYGLYFGIKPVLVVNDPEVMIQICVKDFDVFQDHSPNEFLNDYQKDFLFLLNGQHWKKVRTLMSPTFTSGKIKRMFKFLNICADDLMEAYREQLKSEKDKEPARGIVNLNDTYNLFTMDAITTCCYGLKLERANSTSLKSVATRDGFVKLSQVLFDNSKFRILTAIAAPKSILRFIGFKTRPLSNYMPFIKTVSSLIEARKKTEKKFDDYLQLLVDAKLDDEMELNEMDSEENHHAGLTHESLIEDQKKMTQQVKDSQIESNQNNSISTSKANLSDQEVISNAMFLLSVGLETTSILLTHASYALAHHQDIQKRLYEEIMKIVQFDETKTKITFEYEAITTCRYLDAVLSETLRRLTPVLSTDRVALKDYHLQKYNLDIPEGQVINMNWYGVMNHPDYWEEPTKFNPDRFMPENKDKIIPGSYCPFGLGPRHCVGMRFSLTEAKLAFSKMIVNFRFEPAPDSEFPPKYKTGLGVSKILKPEVMMIERK